MGNRETKFLNNVVDTERNVFRNIFLNPYVPPITQGKERVVWKVFNIVSCQSLFDADYRVEINEKSPDLDLIVGVGHSIRQLRKSGFSDVDIYDKVIEFRDGSLEGQGCSSESYSGVNQKKLALRVYDAVDGGLKDILAA